MENANATISKISLLYQLEQRRVANLERENRALLERINDLLTKEDDERIELLVADRMRRKLVQLRAITERTIKSLESGVNEFRAFVSDINEAMNEEENQGAIRPLKLFNFINESDRILRNFSPKLRRIPESPMVSSISTPKNDSLPKSHSASFHKGLEEEEGKMADDVVDESTLLELMETTRRGTDNEKVPNSKERDDPKGEVQNSPVPTICSVTLRQRSSAVKIPLDDIKRTHIATPALFAGTVPIDPNCEAVGNISMASASVPSTPLSADSGASVTASGRPKRAATSKVGSYQLPSLNKKMRR